MNHKFLQIHPQDNVLVALTDLSAGEVIEFEGKKITLKDTVPAKHKFALTEIKQGSFVYMYGSVVGKSVSTIISGAVLTTANVKHEANSFSEKTETTGWTLPDFSKFEGRTFKGYHRSDGQVGTANYWIVIPLVFCENRNVEVIKQAFVDELGFGKPNRFKSLVQQMADLYKTGKKEQIETLQVEEFVEVSASKIFKNIDGIKFLTHQGGCGGIRQDSDMLCALLAGYINNPNVAGATVLSLGCQNAQPAILKEKLDAINPNLDKPIILLEQQKEGTESNLLSQAIKQTFLAMAEADQQERQDAPLSKLTIGLECGGSDGFSGISANPAVGHVSDLIVALGGKSILSEFPELCGVEQELINRCVDYTIAKKFSKLMVDYAASAEAVGSGFDMNPSPGNIKDGLITDAMKSSGAAKKGGTSPVVDVLDYAEYATKPGLNLLCTPGNDVESTTAMAGSGANIILFTTGLGTPTGNPVTPVIKISSNTKLAERMPDIIDVNTGGVISGEKTIPQMGEEMLEHIIKVASGEIKSKAQLLDQDDFIPWKRGVSL
ncbi:altronate dehydratase [Belliella baltica DSM 15883]|uniref:Altronate dehydratase n=1 Tax=Belliella baltica (strain DSM 15883 / CIP 108006 / LMG 21964 / BA134) TaxID=866536 RepID=I3Z8N4_BELBD|nr:altronate dehydratase family protein [Belliella baltica]AFL85602.1 altronate dehydratase [Belliella baltica DSM 15883]